ncbi:MAG: hypothetical protein ACMUHX_05225 [bacterium]
MSKEKHRFFKGLIVFLIYCLPIILALVLILGFSFRRLKEVGEEIRSYANYTLSGNRDAHLEEFLEDSDTSRQLMHFLKKQKELGVLNKTIADIDKTIKYIWIRNSTIIALLSLLPYLLLGSRLAFDERIRLKSSQLFQIAHHNIWMKFIVGCVIALGWMYVINPLGRAATTVKEFLIAGDIVATGTLPIYIAAEHISHTMAGFLGWYLHLLTYFFRKLYFNDVYSSRVYRFLFTKFLFIYGLALTLSPIMGNETKPALFLIGFFPLSVFSIIKEYSLKAFQGIHAEQDSLSDLPAISRWQILRLEEEGIESVATLAIYDRNRLKELLPELFAPLINLWIESAQLCTILGHERYNKVKKICQTAGEFIQKIENPEFVNVLKNSYDVPDPAGIVYLLKETFGKEKG